MTVGILGMAMKANNDDPRDSLSFKLRKVLLMECKEVLCTDPYVSDPRFTPLAEVIDRANLLIVATPHDCYRSCEFPQPVIDITRSVCSPMPVNGMVTNMKTQPEEDFALQRTKLIFS